VRNALQGAASIAGLLITTEAMVAELPKKEAARPPMPGAWTTNGPKEGRALQIGEKALCAAFPHFLACPRHGAP
jgi:hypothetical protein